MDLELKNSDEVFTVTINYDALNSKSLKIIFAILQNVNALLHRLDVLTDSTQFQLLLAGQSQNLLAVLENQFFALKNLATALLENLPAQLVLITAQV